MSNELTWIILAIAIMLTSLLLLILLLWFMSKKYVKAVGQREAAWNRVALRYGCILSGWQVASPGFGER
jgi:flagellar basal body-associated protein FliL